MKNPKAFLDATEQLLRETEELLRQRRGQTCPYTSNVSGTYGEGTMIKKGHELRRGKVVPIRGEDERT